MNEEYVESETCLLPSGREIKVEYRPSKMHPYSLAKAVRFGFSRRPDICVEHFVRKTVGAVDDAYNSFSFERKLRTEEKRIIERDKRLIKDIWMRSGVHLIKKVLESREPFKYSFSRNGEYNELNKLMFSGRLMQIALGYVHSETTKRVLEDYRLTREIREDPARFKELEDLCERVLEYFVHHLGVLGMDRESQRQEGLMVIWQCCVKYDAENFANFPTMVRKALRNKYKDLLKYFSAHKRRVLKKTFAMGLGEENSRLRDHLDSVSFANWRGAIRNGVKARRYSRFCMPQPSNPVSRFEIKYAVEQDKTEELEDSTSPVGLEKRIEVINAGERFLREGNDSEEEAYGNWLNECLYYAMKNNPQLKTPVIEAEFIPF